MNLFKSNTKTFEEQFEQMLDERRLTGAGRQVLKDLPLDKKELLLSNHQKERKKSVKQVTAASSGDSFWRRVTSSSISRKLSGTLMENERKGSGSDKVNNIIQHPDEVESEFLKKISKLNLPPNELSKYLEFTLSQKAEWLESQFLEENKEKINEAFLSFISKGHVPPDEFTLYLQFTLSQRREFLREHMYSFENEGPPSNLPSIADLTEKSAAWFALKIASKNSSLKSLFRNVQLLRVAFMTQGEDFLKEYLDAMAIDSGTTIDCPKSFEIALERVYAVTDIATAEESTFDLLHSYADQMLPDDIRLEVLKCIDMVASFDDSANEKLMMNGTLLRQICRCLSLPNKIIQKRINSDSTSRIAFLNVGCLVGKLLGPCCFIFPELADLLISEMHELKRLQREALPFIYLISSLLDPFSFSLSPETSHIPDDEIIGEYSSLWQYRTQIMCLFNGIISSGDDLATRLRRRRFFERAGIRSVIRSLMVHRPTDEFILQVKSFNDDRDDDEAQNLKEMRDKTLDVSLSIKSLEIVFQNISALPDSSLLNWLIARSVAHLYDIICSLEGGNPRIREEVNHILTLIEKTSGSLAESVKNFERQYSSDVKLQWKSLYYDTAYDLTGIHEQNTTSAIPSSIIPPNVASFEKEVQRLQQELHAMKQEKSNSQIMNLFNQELASAIHQRHPAEIQETEVYQAKAHQQQSYEKEGAVGEKLVAVESGNEKDREKEELIIKAPHPMKALQWESLSTVMENSSLYWEKTFSSAYNSKLGELLEEEQLLKLFRKQVGQSQSNTGRQLVGQNDSKVRFLDPKLSRNLEIFLSALRKTAKEIKGAILKIDSSILNLDVVTRMQRLIPKDDVMDQILTFEGNFDDLGLGEQFLFTIFSIPRILSRLRCIAYLYRFQEENSEILPDITIIRAGVKEIQSSPEFSYILQLLLVTGNYLNGSSFRGNAYGFKIGSLLNLRSTLSNGEASTPTLLHFIARTLAAKNPACLVFLDKMPNAKAASRISAKAVVAGVKGLATGFKFVKQETSEPLFSVPDDAFREVFDKFVEKGGKKLKSLQDRVSFMSKELASMLEAFGEDSSDHDASERLFHTISNFAQDLQSAHAENVLFDSKKETVVVQVEPTSSTFQLDLQPSGKVELSKMVLATGNLSLARKTIKKF